MRKVSSLGDLAEIREIFQPDEKIFSRWRDNKNGISYAQ